MAKNCDNTLECTCTYPGCPRHGKCCECLQYH
ncbi:MAG TPA: cytosolic protein, partial [Candidatus Hydrogenedentes bacterium]|nr:cytosolic protein [Candidatus Hydrogenedentota bacterium]